MAHILFFEGFYRYASRYDMTTIRGQLTILYLVCMEMKLYLSDS